MAGLNVLKNQQSLLFFKLKNKIKHRLDNDRDDKNKNVLKLKFNMTFNKKLNVFKF